VTDYTKIVAGADRPKELWRCTKNLCRGIKLLGLIFGAVGNFETHITKRFKKERHTGKPP
jgi:hypothetical protein